MSIFNDLTNEALSNELIHRMYQEYRRLEKQLVEANKVLIVQRQIIKELTEVASVHLDDTFEKINQAEDMISRIDNIDPA